MVIRECYTVWTSTCGSFYINKLQLFIYIPAKPLHNHDIDSEHFNNFDCTDICNKLRRDLAMFIYIYFNVDECCLTYSMPPAKV